MKRYLILFSLIIVGLLSYVDTKTRFNELDNEISATTPSQVEMKREIPKSFGEGIQNKPDPAKELARPLDKNNDNTVKNMPQKTNQIFNRTNQLPPQIPTNTQSP